MFGMQDITMGFVKLSKAFHKKYSRKVQKARSLEEFVQVFDKTDDITGTLERLLDASLRDSIDSNQLTKGPSSIMNSQFFQNVTTDAVEQIKEQERLQECREPRPVLLDSHEVIGLDKGLLQFMYPLCIQVNRCGAHSGCCNIETKTCSVKEGHITNVTRQILFAFVYIDKSGSASRQREMKVYTAQVEEHTLCECQESALTREKCNDIICESPKTKNPIDCNCLCPKRCANPYRNNNETCECECGDEQTPAGRTCRKILRGKATMSRSECDCVKTSQCSRPSCRSKYAFDNTTCTCEGLRSPNTERISHNNNDSFELFQDVDLQVRAVKEPPPIKSAQHDVGIVPFVRSSQAHLERNSKEVISTVILKKETIPNPLLSAQITVLNQAADDLNATNIKDRYRVDLKPNGTDHGTIPGPGTATTDVIGKAEKRENPLGLQESEEEINDITSFDYYVDTTEERSSSSSSYEYSSSSSYVDDDDEEIKPEIF
ncbi:vascular endothelial growth factor 2 [Apostichopus japonicus]|uniref:Vascular endothelial growth factor 2 n=1 Tax=Stichopus japonicus TaxID=307972 RepID=A0A2G8KD53_STIJA|nr:vascular endothelial growth factor 2 [Apostichopus japonicus]